jgi:hypothetical protein
MCSSPPCAGPLQRPGIANLVVWPQIFDKDRREKGRRCDRRARPHPGMIRAQSFRIWGSRKLGNPSSSSFKSSHCRFPTRASWHYFRRHEKCHRSPAVVAPLHHRERPARALLPELSGNSLNLIVRRICVTADRDVNAIGVGMIQRISTDMSCLESRPATGNIIVRRPFWRRRRISEHVVQHDQQ